MIIGIVSPAILVYQSEYHILGIDVLCTANPLFYWFFFQRLKAK